MLLLQLPNNSPPLKFRFGIFSSASEILSRITFQPISVLSGTEPAEIAGVELYSPAIIKNQHVTELGFQLLQHEPLITTKEPIINVQIICLLFLYYTTLNFWKDLLILKLNFTFYPTPHLLMSLILLQRFGHLPPITTTAARFLHPTAVGNSNFLPPSCSRPAAPCSSRRLALRRTSKERCTNSLWRTPELRLFNDIEELLNIYYY